MGEQRTESPLIPLGRLWVAANYPYNSTHLLKSLDWLDRLAPDASDAVRLATLTHDMERAFPGPDQPIAKTLSDPEYERAHSVRSARIVGAWLREQAAGDSLVDEVERLILAHEFGGWLEADLVQAADSLSFLETNIELFLAPQFDEHGRSVAPLTYAAMFRAAYDGIKAANPNALVALGETSSHGRDKPSAGFMQDRHSPARFAELLAKEDPPLEFDAWAHHPYPVQTGTRPDALAHWPNVTLPTLERFGQALDGWFGREDIPIWITEVGYEVAPAEPKGVPEDVHADYAAQSLEIAAGVPRVELFVWFAFADSDANEWESGLLDDTGAERPAYESFAAAVREYAAP